MRLSGTNPRRSEHAYIIEILIGILVIIGFAYVFFKIARCLKTINPNPTGTNTTSVSIGYATNYGGNFSSPNSAPESAPQTILPNTKSGNTFTFNYMICPAGWTRVLCQTSNEYKLMLNMTTNLIVMDFIFDGLGGYTELDTTNAQVDGVIYKSTNLVSWIPLQTNINLDPSAIYQFTDTNAVTPSAFYKVLTQ